MRWLALVWLHCFVSSLMWLAMSDWSDVHCPLIPGVDPHLENAIASFTWEASMPAAIIYERFAHPPNQCTLKEGM